jgi:ppGpp synthetase/RelA/SpoT-type nucleotidyltranferase
LRDGVAARDDWGILRQYRLAVREGVAPIIATVRESGGAEALAFTTRLKTDYSVIEKLRRTTIRLRQIDDIMGCRIVVRDIEAQNMLAGKIADLAVAKVRDRRARPSFGYRAVHVILGSGPYLEVQIRTVLQDAWAELSERIADRYGIEAKYGGGPERFRKMMDALSEYVARLENQVSFMIESGVATPDGYDVRTALRTLREQL